MFLYIKTNILRGYGIFKNDFAHTREPAKDTSYENANYLNVRVSVSMLILCILEICLYFFYNNKVNNFSRKISYDFMSNIKIFILAAPMGSDSKGSKRVGCRAGGGGG